MLKPIRPRVVPVGSPLLAISQVFPPSLEWYTADPEPLSTKFHASRERSQVAAHK